MFDLNAFRQADFKPREIGLDFPALKSFGGHFKVRGLTAHEIAQADESAQKGRLVSDLVERLAGSTGKQKAAALLEGIGISNDVPALLAKRYEHVCLGVVEPRLELSDAVKLGETFPIEFSTIANKILELTGQGQIADVKLQSSINEAT